MRADVGGFLARLGTWALFSVCAFYGAFAIYMAGLEILFSLGVAGEAVFRAKPLVFVVHALSGGAALISGPLQFNGRLRRWRRNAHRVIGRVYVGAILISSVTALLLTTTFDVSLATKIALGMIALLWPATTVIALLRILDGDVTRHREWMVRSFSLTLFFVTFSIWVPGLEATALPDSISYPLGVFLSWSLNLLVAELWIRRTKVEWARPLIPKQKRERGRRHAGARQVVAAQTADLLIPDLS